MPICVASVGHQQVACSSVDGLLCAYVRVCGCVCAWMCLRWCVFTEYECAVCIISYVPSYVMCVSIESRVVLLFNARVCCSRLFTSL